MLLKILFNTLVTVNSQQSTVNSQQSTVNSQQSTVNSQQNYFKLCFDLYNKIKLGWSSYAIFKSNFK